MRTIGIKTAFLTKLRQGDSQAIGQLYEEAFDYCASVILKNNGTIEDAKDIFQEVLLVFIKKLRTTNFTIEHDINAYLYRITHNLWLKRLRVDKKKGLSLVVDEPGNKMLLSEEEILPEKRTLDKRQAHLYKALKALKDDCRQLLQLTFFEKLGDKEIAEETGYSYAFVPQKRRRCIAKLKQMMVK